MANAQDKLMKALMPVATWVEKRKHLQAVKDGMIGATAFIIVGSMCLIPMALMNLIGSGPVYDFLGRINPFFLKIAGFTNDYIGLYAAYLIARSLAKRDEIDGPIIGINAVVVQLILTGFSLDGVDGAVATAYFGSQGLFVSIISGLITVDITQLFITRGWVIKLPDSVPEMVANSFSALIPVAATCGIASLITVVSQSAAGQVFPALLQTLLAPAITSMDTLPALLIVIFLTQLLWFFGLHGPSITQAVWAPFAIAYATENVAAYAAGEAATHVFTYGFYYNILQVTGSGLTLALVVFMMLSKCETYKAVGRAAIVPSLFGINEPVIFGLPIMLNPFMFAPFVLGPLVPTIIAWFAFKSGLVGMPVAVPPGFMPPGVGAFLMTYDWKAVVLVFVLLGVMAVFYYPFFKAMERETLAREKQQETEAHEA